MSNNPVSSQPHTRSYSALQSSNKLANIDLHAVTLDKLQMQNMSSCGVQDEMALLDPMLPLMEPLTDDIEATVPENTVNLDLRSLDDVPHASGTINDMGNCSSTPFVGFEESLFGTSDSFQTWPIWPSLDDRAPTYSMTRSLTVDPGLNYLRNKYERRSKVQVAYQKICQDQAELETARLEAELVEKTMEYELIRERNRRKNDTT